MTSPSLRHDESNHASLAKRIAVKCVRARHATHSNALVALTISLSPGEILEISRGFRYFVASNDISARSSLETERESINAPSGTT